MPVCQFFIIFAADLYKGQIKARILLGRKQNITNEIKTLKI